VYLLAGSNRRGSYVRISDKPTAGGYMVPFAAAADVADALRDLVAVGDPTLAAEEVPAAGKTGAAGPAVPAER
jgi:hypothetical protein